jgi:DNA-directed RNA polymerase subunit omega
LSSSLARFKTATQGHQACLLEKDLARRKRNHFNVAFAAPAIILPHSTLITMEKALNAELTKKALEKVGNPNVLVNLVSRRVRQLNSGGGAISRPLVERGNLGAADIALLEIIEEKIGFEMPEVVELTRPTAKKRKKH